MNSQAGTPLALLPALAAHAQEWNAAPAALRAWQRGRTGFPLVDAGMRQLWATGWMQQSVRMVCAAFLTEYLSLHWVHGCRHVLGRTSSLRPSAWHHVAYSQLS